LRCAPRRWAWLGLAIRIFDRRKQKFLFVDDGENNVIWTVLREDGTVVGQMGHSGRNAGQFHWVHQIVSDSQGNLYTGEVDTGKRIQKFVLQH